jgi:hypothetical protein
MEGQPAGTEETMTIADNKFQWKGGIVTRIEDWGENLPNSIPGLNSAALAGKMICMNGKVFKS